MRDAASWKTDLGIGHYVYIYIFFSVLNVGSIIGK